MRRAALQRRFAPYRRLIAGISLDRQLILIFMIIGLISAAATYAVLAALITPSFSKLEHDQVRSHVERTNAALSEYAIRVETAVRDYGAWTDSFDYLAQPTRSFETDTFSILAMTNLDVNGMAYVGFDGKVVFSRWVDLDAQIEVQTLGRELDALLSSPRVLAAARARPAHRFYARIGDRIAAVSIAQIVRTDGSGTPRGFVAMARQINSAQLSKLLQLEAHLDIEAAAPPHEVDEQDERIRINIALRGIDNRQIAVARFAIDRAFSQLGLDTLKLSVLGVCLIMALTLVVLSRLFHRLVIAPLRRVEGHMQHVTASATMVALDIGERRDEIGSLVLNLNTMLKQLKDLREQVEIQSFKLGRSESAVSVMHNVRNGLNPVSVILARTLGERPATSAEDIARAIRELGDPATDPARRDKLVAFLNAAHQAALGRRAALVAELKTARACLGGVIELIGRQQAATHEKIETERCDVTAIIEQNGALAQYSASGNIRFEMGEDAHFALANRILLSQVIGNLFANAVESISEIEREHGVIEVSVSAPSPDQICIRIRDNGEGFDHARGQDLFERGYSSRKEKSGGLGLHWCANAIRLMQGSLELSSEGVGLGAVATITLRQCPRDEGLAQLARADRAAPVRARDIAA